MKYVFMAIFIATIFQITLWISDDKKVITPPDAQKVIQSFSYSPYIGDDKTPRVYEEAKQDLIVLKKLTNKIRLYATEDAKYVIEAAKDLNMSIDFGIWISADKEKNEKEIEEAINYIKFYYNMIDSVIVGNEVLLRADVTEDELVSYINRVRENVAAIRKEKIEEAKKLALETQKSLKNRKKLKEKDIKVDVKKIPITSADIWYTWHEHPDVAEYIDFMTVHILPYWEKVDVKSFIPFFEKTYKEMQEKFPGKKLFIGEFGWPSKGYNNEDAKASLQDQATAIRQFLILAHDKKYSYNIIEAFDQQWKGKYEGSVGPYWGLFDADRNQKFELQGPVILEPLWVEEMFFSVFIGIILIYFGLRNEKVNFWHAMVYGVVAQGMAFSIVMAAMYPFVHYMNFGTWVMWIMGLVLMIPLTIITLAKANELFKFTIGVQPQRLIKDAKESSYEPLVSIHVPAYKEQPHVLIETLEALSKLKYQNYEVLVIINNTPEDYYKTPVKEYCEKLGEKFVYLDIKCTGFKAGALNEALKYTSKDAQILAVIDADYVVESNWLSDLVPLFEDEKVALVQAPQDHRDGDESLLKKAMNAEYAGFFDIGMVKRNEENAIVAHGTMIMVRLSAMKEVGDWTTDTIVEDSELGLRLFEAGYIAHYTSKRYGYGLLPDTIEAFKNQRHRWAYGAVQILKKHWQNFKPSSKTLTGPQKYNFITGWFFWLSDALGTMTAVLNIVWTPVIIFIGVTIPTLALTIPILISFLVNLLHAFILYRTRVKIDFVSSFFGAIAAMSLQLTIFRAVWDGFVKDNLPFKRTEKGGNSKKRSDNPMKDEQTLAILLFVSFVALIATNKQQIVEIYLFAFTILVQSIPYFSAIALRFIEKQSSK